VLWSAGLLTYILLARRAGETGRALLTGGGILLLAVLHFVLQRFPAVWDIHQISLASGVDQLSVFDGRYSVATGGLIVIFGAVIIRKIREQGTRQIFADIPFQMFVLTAAAIALLPAAVHLPQY
jgi:hypothetical protein